MSYLKQKSKCHWLREGDQNTAYFHRCIQQRRVTNRIYAIKDKAGILREKPDDIEAAFLDFYKELLGTKAEQRTHVNSSLVRNGKVVVKEDKVDLCRPFTTMDVKEAMWQIAGDKAPGPDGYTSQFYKTFLDIVGDDTCEAILDFFQTGKSLKQVNANTITLIPKVKCPSSVNEFKPISCCNTLYKFISKMLYNRLGKVLPKIIDESQCAFVEGRSIVQNVLICQELTRGFSMKNNKPKCIMKIDLRKAYDIVSWDFIEEMLAALQFPLKFIRWIMSCISSTAFSLMINGSLCGFIKGENGFRHGDPISPLLFVICVEYLSRILKEVASFQNFKFYPGCRPLKLSNVLF